MKVLIQRVLKANVVVAQQEIAAISKGFLVLVGVEKNDAKQQAEYLAKKTANLRIFEDENGKMNRSILEVEGQVLAVSQFTLAGDTSRGNRPGFETAAKPEDAKPLYEYFCKCLQDLGLEVKRGIFQADMKVGLINDGPVTFMLERR